MKILQRWRRKKTKSDGNPVKPIISRQVSKSGRKLTKINHAFWQKFESDLISADLPASLVIDLILKVRQRFVVTSSELVVRRYMQQWLIKYYGCNTDPTSIILHRGRANVHLILGVNGVGKTTTIAKLAHFYQQQRQRILLIAADTFRAGAVTQLQTWAKILKVTCFVGKPGQSPASVVYQGLANAEHYDLVLIDTAGRLHNKVSLMQEISKMNTVIKKQTNHWPDAVLLVMDAQTGRNATAQAQQFTKQLPVSAIVLTKTDSTAKGGAAIAIGHELKLPIRWIGTGERINDLKLFRVDDYVARLVGLADNER